MTLNQAQITLQSSARQLAERVIAPRAAQIDVSEAYPWDNVADLVDAGFMGMTLPQAHGGRGLSYLDAVVVYRGNGQGMWGHRTDCGRGQYGRD